jgi:hypothetical protein
MVTRANRRFHLVELPFREAVSLLSFLCAAVKKKRPTSVALLSTKNAFAATALGSRPRARSGKAQKIC